MRIAHEDVSEGVESLASWIVLYGALQSVCDTRMVFGGQPLRGLVVGAWQALQIGVDAVAVDDNDRNRTVLTQRDIPIEVWNASTEKAGDKDENG
jgi:hypothetical protein